MFVGLLGSLRDADAYVRFDHFMPFFVRKLRAEMERLVCA